MQVAKEIFKAYDIRGVYPSQLNEDVSYAIALAFATLRRKELGKTPRLVVGRDMRLSGPALHEKLLSGLLEGGCEILDIGVVSTPTFYFAVSLYGYDGGIMISASHNPKEHNGFKITRDRAMPLSGDTGLGEIRNIIESESFEKTEKKGRVEKKDDVLRDQLEFDLGFGDVSRIKPLVIVADAANAMGSLYLTELFLKLPCRLIKMNFDLDGSFPAHEADPYKSKNVLDLGKRVVSENADLGIATDGDGDRIFFLDEKGVPVDPGIIRGILSKIFLKVKPGSKIAYDIRPGRITRDMILEYGGVPVVSKVGHSLIKKQSIEQGVYFAGESSGHFFLDVGEGFYEVPMIVILKILEELSASGKTFSEYLKPLQKYFHSGEINSEVDKPDQILEKLEKKYSQGKIEKLDGLSVEFEDFWFNVRKSNTENLLRLNLEAIDQKTMEEKRDEVLESIRGK